MGIIDISIENESAFEKQLRKALERKMAGFMKSLLEVLKTDFVKDYMELFDSLYDELLLSTRSFDPEDQTSPAYLKPVVYKYIKDKLIKSLNNISTNGLKEIHIRVIAKAVWDTVPDDDEKNLVKLFYFYLVGIMGKYVFVTEEVFKNLVPMDDDKPLGRFGNGYLLKYDTYAKRRKKIVEANPYMDSKLKHPDEIVSPLSGLPPVRLFEVIVYRLESKLPEYVEKAKSKQ